MGLQGEVTLFVLTDSGMEITLKEPLDLDHAAFIESPGIRPLEAKSHGIDNQMKLKDWRKEELELKRDDQLPQGSSPKRQEKLNMKRLRKDEKSRASFYYHYMAAVLAT